MQGVYPGRRRRQADDRLFVLLNRLQFVCVIIVAQVTTEVHGLLHVVQINQNFVCLFIEVAMATEDTQVKSMVRPQVLNMKLECRIMTY